MAAVKRELSDAENKAVQDELLRLKGTLGSWRAVGKALGFPPQSDQQTISRAYHVRAGREVADRLYAYLATDRDAFLLGRGVVSVDTVTEVLEETDWSALGLDAEGAARVVGHITEAISTAAASRADEARLRSVPVAVPKAPLSRPRRTRQ